MRLLLDTQILIWMVTGDRRLRSEWIAAIADPGNSLHVSAVTAFEYADLQSRRRIPIDESLDELGARFDLTIEDLPVACWRVAARLPSVHRDPLDRMLVAHAIAGNMTLMTADATIRSYPVACI
jgi:PIN domain nuclease of toxin-antitoxin system